MYNTESFSGHFWGLPEQTGKLKARKEGINQSLELGHRLIGFIARPTDPMLIDDLRWTAVRFEVAHSG